MPFILNQPENWKFAHVHVPRTAGISIYWFFVNAAGAAHCKRYGTDDEVKELELLSAAAHQDFTFIAGHVPCWLLRSKLDMSGTFLFTTMREPIARELSAFQHMVNRKSDKSFFPVRAFDDYLALLQSRPDLCGLQKKFLCVREELIDASPAHVLSQYLAAGYAYVDVGGISILQEYLKLILDKPFIIEWENRGLSRPEPTPAQLSKLAELIKDDVELYSLLRENGLTAISDWRFGWSDT